jgi:amidase
MPIDTPNLATVAAIAEERGLNVAATDIRGLLPFMHEIKQLYDELDQLRESALTMHYPMRRSFSRPSPEDNPHNAWYVRTEISPRTAGPLNGKRVALKDNICLASIPMMNGSRLIEGFVPEIDATVVTRILEAGGTITGKSVCEDLCLSGASHTSKTGPVRNKWSPIHSSGGSSSGSATLVASGEVDIAIGTDQGGSVRIPASWSGVYGLKPTYGLVPYTGIFPIEMTLDHCGPIAGSVKDLACMLSVIAGTDGYDPRQRDVRIGDYIEAVSNLNVSDLRIGVVQEGFGHSVSEGAVDNMVRQAARRLAELGARLDEVSIPFHRTGYAIWAIILLEGSTDLLFNGGGIGGNWEGYYMGSLHRTFSIALRDHPHDIPETGKLNLLMAEFVRRGDFRSYYALAQNLRPGLRRAYDNALRNFDLLLMPTVPFRATQIPSSNCSVSENIARARDAIDVNTALIDATGHPAISFPCGLVEELPVGAMLIGRHWEDATVLRAAHAFESHYDWRRL